MSLTSSPDCLFRPEDGALKTLFASCANESSSFDDFFNEDMYRFDSLDDENKAQSSQFDDLFSHEAFTKDQYRLFSSDATSKPHHSPPQPWRQGLWSLKQRQQQPPGLVVEKTRRLETKRPEAIQTMNAASRYGHATQGPQLPADVSQTKRFATSPNAGRFNPATNVRPPFSREVTLSPSPMYAKLPISGRAARGDMSTWQQDFQNFHLRLPYESPLPSPSSTRMRDDQRISARAMNSAIMAQNHGVHLPRMGFGADSDHSAAVDPLMLNQNRYDPQSDHLAYSQEYVRSLRPQATSHMPMLSASPTSGSLASSSSSNQSREGRTHTPNTNLSMHSHLLCSPSTMSGHPPLPTLAPEENYPLLAAPAPRRAPHHILHEPADTSLAGLGIQYPELEQMSQAVLYEPHGYLPQVLVPMGMAVPYPPTPGAGSGPMSSYPALPPPPAYIFSESSPFTTPRTQRRSPSRSPSPPVSPGNISARRHRQRSPTRAVTDHSRSRRKSIHKAGPIRDAGGPEPLPTTRTRSASRPPRTPKGPKTPTSGTPMIDFVNFTPKDSAKLLNDVAPSGSSKTRARRELEAREKRKKLSEAALKAVQTAGGDVAAFEKAIFA